MGLQEKIADIINQLSVDDDNFFEADEANVSMKSSMLPIRNITLNELSSSLIQNKFKTEMKTRKRRRSDSPPNKVKPDVPSKQKVKKISMFDEIDFENVNSAITTRLSLQVAKLPNYMNKNFQTFPLNSLKGISVSKKRKRTEDVRPLERIEIGEKIDKKANGANKYREAKPRRQEFKTPPKKSKSKHLDDPPRTVKTPPKKSKSKLVDDPPWTVKSPKFNKKLSVTPINVNSSPKNLKRKSRDYEEFVEYRGAKLISDLECTDDESSDEHFSPNHKRRYTIKLESSPLNIKSILSPKESSSKTRKKINFCSKVFIRNFIPTEYHTDAIDLS